jgi:hypothetical protein
MEIIQERLRREFNMDVISTYPSVIYQVSLTDGEELIVDNPAMFPEQQEILEVREPMVQVYVMIPGEYIGDIMSLVMEKRGEVTNTETIGRVLYTDYVYFFQAAGLVLLVAMIGAIVLTLRHKPGVKRQVIADQVARTPAAGMRIVSVKPGEGIQE